MAVGSGLSSQIGYAKETTYGTPATASRFLPLISEDLGAENERMESEGIVAGAIAMESDQWAPGTTMVSGGIQHELYQQGVGLLFEQIFGSVTSSATGGIATHTFTLGDLPSMTVQKGVPTVGGNVLPFTYAGAMVSEANFRLAAGEFAQLGLTVLAQSETDGIALAAASYLTGSKKPFSFMSGAISISGAALCVREVEININNGLTDERICIGQEGIDKPIRNELAVVDGSATIEFTSTAQYQRFRQGLETSMVLALSASPSARCTFTLNTRWDGATPQVGGKGLVVVEYPFKAVATPTAQAIQAVLVNSQTSL